ncbi:MAG: hypothetical protein QM751_00655 [Paludibacteraceae bacterium]
MKRFKLIIISFAIISIGIHSQNTGKKWGYLLQIVNNDYIPQIDNTDSFGYITLHTGIADYDAIFARYKITEFYQYLPSSDIEWMRQTYFLVCDSGQVELGNELNAKYSDVIPHIEIFYLTPDLTGEPKVKIESEHSILVQSNGIINLTGYSGLSKRIYLYNQKGELLYSKKTSSDIIYSKKLFSKGIILYQIIINNIRKSGMTIVL